MSIKFSASERKQLWPWLTIAAIFVVTVIILRIQGRLWICSCGQIYLWVGDIWSSNNSQHIADPYAFSHILHGFVFLWLLVWAFPRLAMLWQLTLAVLIEATWEVVENSAFIIERYREATASLGYEGDAIINSVADLFFCAIGFFIARYLGFWRSLAVFILTEIILLIWIRDSLIVNVIMLIYPIDAIRVWQLGG